MLNLFGSQQAQPIQIFGLDAGLLSLALDARLQLRTAATSDLALLSQNVPSGPAVIAPWEVPSDPKTLARRINEVRDLQDFIDLQDESVKAAGGEPDRQTLFALFNAITALQTLAQYAAEDATPSSLLDNLDATFQRGLAQVSEFLETQSLNQLDLFFGDKEHTIESRADLGKNTQSFTGSVAQTGLSDDPIEGITGDEVFNVSITKFGETTDIVVDLSELNGVASINSIVDLANQKISAIQATDTNGDLVFDGEGNPVSKFTTRFKVELTDTFDFAIKVEGALLESTTLSAAAAEPALFVTSNTNAFTSDVETGTLTRIEGLDTSDPNRVSTTTIAGEDSTAAEFLNAVSGFGAADKPTFDFITDVIGGNDKDDDAEIEPILQRTSTSGVAVDSTGSLYVIGTTEGDLDGQINNAKTQDVFLSKLDSNGNVIFSRLLGVATDASAYAVTVDADDNVIIVGETDAELTSPDIFSGTDSFVTKFSSRGDEIFTYQLDSAATDRALSVTTDANGDVFVSGESSGSIGSGLGFAGGKDGYVIRLDGTTGERLDATRIGGSGIDSSGAVATASDGNILVASTIGTDVVLKKLDATDLSNELFSVNLGSIGVGSVDKIVVEGSNIYIAGSGTNQGYSAGGATNSHSGSRDGFVTAVTDNGSSASASFTTFVGSGAGDTIEDLTVSNGTIYLAGATSGTVGTDPKTGASDTFVARVNGTSGAIEFVEQFGKFLGTSEGTGVTFANTGTSVLTKLGLPTGTLEIVEERDIVTQTSVRDGDHFFVSIDGGPAKKITIDAGDDFDDVALQINLAGLAKVEASTSVGDDGDTLKIKAVAGHSVEIFAGEAGADALAKLGIEPTRLLSAEEIFDLDDEDVGIDPTNLGGVFALGLDRSFNILDKTSARYVLAQLDNSISTIQRAFRSLTFDPLKALVKNQLQNQAGQAPAFLTKQIANYTGALLRLQASSQSSGTGFSI